MITYATKINACYLRLGEVEDCLETCRRRASTANISATEEGPVIELTFDVGEEEAAVAADLWDLRDVIEDLDHALSDYLDEGEIPKPMPIETPEKREK